MKHAKNLLILCFLLAGCASPCDEIADAVCAAAGEESEECAQLRTKADRADEDAKKACAFALQLREDLAKAR